MSTDDKKKGLDDAVDSSAKDTEATADTQTIEDAEVVSETNADGDSVEATADDAVEAEAPKAEDADETAPEAEADAETEAEAEAKSDADVEILAEDDADAEKETTVETAPVLVADAPASSDEPKASSGAGVMSTVAGGALAAVLGFGAAQFIDVDWLQMTGLGKDPVAVELSSLTDRLVAVEAAAQDTSAVETTMTSIANGMTGTMTSLTEEVSSLGGAVSGQMGDVDETLKAAQAQVAAVATQLATVEEAMANVDTRLSGVGEHMQSVNERLAAVDARLVEVEKRPLVESSETAKAAFEVYERELEELRTNLQAQRDEALGLEQSITDMTAKASAQMTSVAEQAEEQMAAVRNQTEMELEAVRAEAQAQIEAAQAAAAEAEANAAARAALAVAQASLAQVEAALNAGISYEVALPALAAVTDVPAVIADNGATGIPTLLMLQESYTPAARAALDTSIKGTMSEDPANRVLAFLRTQTGVRSLEAREGNDPDAVLSRMTVAVEAGDLATALAEVPNLPDAGQAAMSDWVTGAQARLDAEAALPVLAASVNNS